MSLSPLHDGEKKLFGQFVEAVAQELEIPYQAFGQTTWKRPEVRRGLESDECYYFKPEKIAAGSALLRLPARNDSSVALSNQIWTVSKTAMSDIAPAIAVKPRVLGGNSAFPGMVMTP